MERQGGFMIIEVLKKKAKWYWRLKSPRGHILAHSEQYCNRPNAIRGARNILNNIHKLRLVNK